jgi:two-component system sensor histidine kinase AgrC
MYLIYNKITNKFTLIIGIFAFLVIIFSSNLAMFLFWRYLLEKHQNKIRQNEISSLLTYVSAIEETYKKIREFKHDYKNILLGISVKDDKLIREELEKAINSTLFNINSNDIISDLSVIENVPVKAILSAKIIHFLNNDMDVHFGIIGKVRDIDMDEYDIVRVLGILLDNAYEEAINTKERYIKIVILKKAESLIFIIENSCGDTTVQIETIMESGYSTKGKGRGLGLANLRDITSTYDNCSFQIGKTDDGNFCAKLIIDTL